ncbi:MAG: type 2 lantipeptide synthetase LanM family protein [Aphanocapsa lilacina HA4352-LM1]|nr:type 2 lantipeptide synthetase LanM family protein [Aphanocapsa lilacina HA4352-LM1]
MTDSEKNNMFTSFYKASLFTERTKVLQNRDKQKSDLQAVIQQAKQWHKQLQFDDIQFFEEYLNSNNLTQEEFLSILTDHNSNYHTKTNNIPEWWKVIEEAMFLKRRGLKSDNNCTALDKLATECSLANILQPLIDHYLKCLEQNILLLVKDEPYNPINLKRIQSIALNYLTNTLMSMSGQTLVLELHVAKLNETLTGETTEERFRSFVHYLQQPNNIRSLFEEYPLLVRQLVEQSEHYIASMLTFLKHLLTDWARICDEFPECIDAGELIHIESTGDSHRGGKSVLMLEFLSGFKLLYKPRSLRLDLCFQNLLNWLNVQEKCLLLKTLRILDCNDHGWTEHVAVRECTKVEEVVQFYKRQGYYLSLLYILESTDFHYENIIAQGDQPILVDLEGLFQPRFEANDKSSATRLAIATLEQSVMRIGVLPQRIWMSKNYDGIDVSALGAGDIQESPDFFLNVENSGTAEVKYVRKREILSNGHHRPRLNGNDIEASEYVNEVIEGFVKIWEIFSAKSTELLSEKSPLEGFRDCEIRVLFRSTRTYASVLSESYHPNLLRDVLHKQRFFDKLWLEVKEFPILAKVVASEQRDLWIGDIPIFTATPASTDVYDSQHRKVTGLIKCSSIDVVYNRLKNLNAEDMEKQIFLIKASMATLDTSKSEIRTVVRKMTFANQTISTSPGALIDAAKSIGKRLDSLAIRCDQDIDWISLVMVRHRHAVLSGTGLTLYDGLPGLALFLAYLGKISEESKYAYFAESITNIAIQHFDKLEGTGIAGSVGAFDGLPGFIYVLAHLDALWERKDLRSVIHDLINKLPALIEQTNALDIISGLAGCLAVLVSICEYGSVPIAYIAAHKCGEILSRKISTVTHGDELVDNGKLISSVGFAHGLAGIAWALNRLANFSKDNRYRHAATYAIQLERNLSSLSIQNSLVASSWCNGASGIGLSRLGLSLLSPDNTYREEVEIATKVILKQTLDTNHSLCHGDLGNIELLLQANKILQNVDLHNHIHRNW